MSVTWTVANKRGSEYLFDPADLVINPDLNGRYEAPDVEPLIADILEKGQLQPILVRNDGGKPVVVAGFSRWRAISEINRRNPATPLKIRCTFFRGDEREGFFANLAENLKRNDTTPLDDAHNCRKLEAWGMSTEEIAQRLQQTEPWVRGRLQIAEATPELKQAIKDGRLKPTAAITIAKLAAEQQRKAVSGNGTVKAPVTKPGAAALRAKIIEAWCDTTQPKPVRKFCEDLVREWWPAVIAKEEQAEEETDAE